MAITNPIKSLYKKHKLTAVAENYLLAIYNLKEQKRKATLTELADELRNMPAGEGLGTSLPSVAAMIRRMSKDKLLEMTSNKEVQLSLDGEELAEGMVRRHRLAERMVTDLLGLELHKAHIEAHRLEHAISPDVEAKIEKALGNPTTSPFGHRIPGTAYSPPSTNEITLDRANVGETYIVSGIPEEDQKLLEYLVDSNFLPGTHFSVQEAAQFKGVISLNVEGKSVMFGYKVASRVWIYKNES